MDGLNSFVEHVKKFVDENPESAEAASNALDAILRTYPSAPDMEVPTMPPSFGFCNLPPISPPHPMGHDIFVDYIDHSAFYDPIPEFVAALFTNPSPESASDQEVNGATMNGTSGSIQSMQILRPAQEDLLAAKQLVNEKKIMAFSFG